MFVGRMSDAGRWIAVVFDDNYVHLGIRAYPRTAS